MYIYFERNRSASKFGFKFLSDSFIDLFIVSIHISNFRVVFRKRMINLGVFFSFYRGDCFDRNVVLFNSRICVRECSFGVNCPWKTLASLDYVWVNVYIY